MKYRKKPIIIEAIKYNGDNHLECGRFVGDPCIIYDSNDNSLTIPTLEGYMKANEGDYIIKGIKGEFYPCREYIFEAIYERVTE
jgi:hypothetical protein